MSRIRIGSNTSLFYNTGLKYIIFMLPFLLAVNSFASGDISPDRSRWGFSVKGYTHYVLIECDNVREASKYEIRYSTPSSGLNTNVKTSDDTRFEIKDLKPNTVYHFQGRVFNHSKWSDWSVIKSCKTATFSTTIGTYNILSSQYDNIFPNNTWKERKEAMRDIIIQANNQPDIFGIQEGMVKKQVLELASLLGDTYVSHISDRNI